MNKTLIIGLTGNIGSGKSTVSRYLMNKGYDIIDADRISRDMTSGKDNSLVLHLAEELKKNFDLEVLNADLSLNRRALADFAFNNIEVKVFLERLVTGKIVEEIKSRISDIKNLHNRGVHFLDAPLLFETPLHDYVDYIWLVTSPIDERIKRVKLRDGISEESVMSRENNQLSEEYKIQYSDEILNNDGAIEELYEQIEGLLKKYVEL